MDQITALFELLKGGIQEDDVPHISDSVSWPEVLLLAQQQTVVGVSFQGISKLPSALRPPQPIYLKWLALAAKIQQRNDEVDAVAAKLFDLLHQNHLHAVLIKGQGVARYYPDPALRQSGDIDLYTGEDFQKSCSLLRLEGSEESNDVKHFCYEWHGVHVENHRRMMLLADKHHQILFDNMLNTWFPLSVRTIRTNSGSIFVPPLQFDAVFILNHLFHHFIDGGVGLRQVMDWLLVMRTAAADTTFDRNRFERDLEDLDLLPCAQLLAAFGVHHLGFQEAQLPIAISSDADMERLITDDILTGGNWGRTTSQRPEGNYSGRWYGFVCSIRRAKRFRMLAPREMKHYTRYRIKYFLLNFIKF